MQEQREKKYGKIEIYSDEELFFSCSDKFLIREKSDCFQKSRAEKPESRMEEVQNPTQRRVLKRD